MTPEQIQEVVMGTVHGMITSGELVGEMPQIGLMGEQPEMPQQMPQMPGIGQ
jgi:hypothetical protein